VPVVLVLSVTTRTVQGDGPVPWPGSLPGP